MPEMKKYSIECRKGVDDLKSIYAFHGTSQGNTGGFNTAGASLNSNGWIVFSEDFKNKGIDPSDQKAIDKYSKEIAAENDKYITQLHKEGKYGEEYEVSIKLVYNPLYDAPSLFSDEEFPLENYSITFLDFNKNK